jgi:4-aminobutyrate aminotransferase / (S)-3-amino-2-methylpropionate transaminase / 5-aminovalerate transaminase
MTIQLVTEIPGPKSRALMEARRKSVARGPFHTTPIFAARAHGSVIEDVDGNTLLDFACGIAVTNLGHTPDDVVAAITAQAGRLLHSSINVVPYEGYVALAERLNRITPGDFPKKTFLANSGAEAVENAVKIARAFTGRQAVICFDHAFHGRTQLALTLTAKLGYRSGFAPFAPEVYRAPFPYAYRCAEADVAEASFRALDELVTHHVGRKNVAAVIIEPVLGEGGFIDAPGPYLRRLREYCSEHGIVLIADEIQTGFGRTGTLFACEHHGVAPDMVTLAKGLGSGLPISAVTGRAEIMDAPAEGGIGGTYGGNPVACAAALAVIDRIEADGRAFLVRARALGEILRARLDAWKARFDVIGDVRGLGPMLGMELVKDRRTKEPDKASTAALVRYACEHGVVLLSAGTYGNVIRFLPPLTISDDELAEGLLVVEQGLDHLQQGSAQR